MYIKQKEIERSTKKRYKVEYMVTIKDVAAEAQVSFQLAAAVLNNKKYARASEATRKKIMDASKKLGYVPNVSARILRGDASKVLGVLIESRAPETMYRILAEIELAADVLGYRILTAQAHDDPEKLLQSYYALKQNGVDGIISFSHDYSQFGYHLDQRLRDDPKIVLVLNSDKKQNISAVDIDLKNGVVAAVEHLRSQGYQKTALLLPSKDLNELPQGCRRRLDGFRQGCPEGEVLLLKSPAAEISVMEEEFRSLIREALIPGGFDSVIALNDLTALVLMNQLLAENIRIPQEFGVVGCDDLAIGLCHPVKLTTLHYDRKAIAESALKMLLDKIAGKPDIIRMDHPVTLISRASTAKTERKS